MFGKKVLLVLLVAVLACAVAGCDGGGDNDPLDTIDAAIKAVEGSGDGLVKWGNETADAVNDACEKAGIPNGVSGEAYKKIMEVDWQEAVHDKDFFK